MKNPNKAIQNGIFLITEERSCPLYDSGEEIKVENHSIAISSYKPVCIMLAKSLSTILTDHQSPSPFPRLCPKKVGGADQKKRYDCGGCGGIIYFEYKQQKEYATLQMKMLKEAEDRRKKQHLDKFFRLLRQLEIFQSLEDDALSDLTVLLDLKTILADKVVVKKGDPGVNLFIVLQGHVVMIGEDGAREEEIRAGDIFGEMSLLSGEPVAQTMHTLEPTLFAIFSVKNFKTVLRNFPELQIFLFKLLVEQVQAKALRSGNITSGMTGKLEEVAAVDLFQLINSSQKTGKVELAIEDGKALILFVEGEIVAARYGQKRDKEALFALLTIKKGQFSYTRGVEESVRSTPPIGGFMGLMMEGLQRIDEGCE